MTINIICSVVAFKGLPAHLFHFVCYRRSFLYKATRACTNLYKQSPVSSMIRTEIMPFFFFFDKIEIKMKLSLFIDIYIFIYFDVP